MRKEDIVKEVCEITGIDRNAGRLVIDETFNVIRKELCKGNSIYIRGLFTLSAEKRAEKTARDISRGKGIIIPAHCAPHAKFSKKLREEMRNVKLK